MKNGTFLKLGGSHFPWKGEFSLLCHARFPSLGKMAIQKTYFGINCALAL